MNLAYSKKEVNQEDSFIDNHKNWINSAEEKVHSWLKGYLLDLKYFIENIDASHNFINEKWKEWTSSWKGIKTLVKGIENKLSSTSSSFHKLEVKNSKFIDFIGNSGETDTTIYMVLVYCDQIYNCVYKNLYDSGSWS